MKLSQAKERCRIKAGWEDAGKQGLLLGYVKTTQVWCIIQWDGEEDPDLRQSAGIEVQELKWRDALT